MCQPSPGRQLRVRDVWVQRWGQEPARVGAAGGAGGGVACDGSRCPQLSREGDGRGFCPGREGLPAPSRLCPRLGTARPGGSPLTPPRRLLLQSAQLGCLRLSTVDVGFRRGLVRDCPVLWRVAAASLAPAPTRPAAQPSCGHQGGFWTWLNVPWGAKLPGLRAPEPPPPPCKWSCLRRGV